MHRPFEAAARLCLLTLLLLIPADASVVPDGPPAGTWRLDPHRSVVQFTVTKLGFADVTGRFQEFAGTVHYDPAHPENSTVEWAVKVASVHTGERGRDESLPAPEYFDAARHPELTFRSTRVSRMDEGRLQVEGTITLRGVSRPIGVTVQPVDGGFETRFELDRYDFGIVGGRVMSRLIGRTVRVHLLALADREER